MKMRSYLEHGQRGTADFPMEIHFVNSNHHRYHMQFHWHSDIEIIHVSHGVLPLMLNNTQYSVGEGESMLIPGGIVHGAFPEDCIYECIVFSKSLLYAAPETKKLIKTKLAYPVKLKKGEVVEHLINCMKEHPEEKLRQIAFLYEIVSEALKLQIMGQTFSEERIERVKPAIVYMEDNYSQHITVEELATQCHMSNNYFIKYFKEVTGQTPVEFLNKCRMEAACEMILSGNNVTETAFACGFNDLSYFIHVFKKNLGVSPKKYADKC